MVWVQTNRERSDIMVSLINFKIVSDELQEEQRPRELLRVSTTQLSHQSDRMFIKVMQNEKHCHQAEQTCHTEPDPTSFSNKSSSRIAPMAQQQQQLRSNEQIGNKCHHNSGLLSHRAMFVPPNPYNELNGHEAGKNQCEQPSFVVTWRNLRFAIEPKWRQKLVGANPLSMLASQRDETTNARSTPGSQTSSASQQPQAASTKVVLDKLDGSFRSGELTAILGPSGK